MTLERKLNLFAGRQLIIELGKRGLRGYFFTYEQNQGLKKIQNLTDLKKEIVKYGYPSIMDAKDIKEIVDIMNANENKKTTGWVILEIVFWSVISLTTCS